MKNSNTLFLPFALSFTVPSYVCSSFPDNCYLPLLPIYYKHLHHFSLCPFYAHLLSCHLLGLCLSFLCLSFLPISYTFFMPIFLMPTQSFVHEFVHMIGAKPPQFEVRLSVRLSVYVGLTIFKVNKLLTLIAGFAPSMFYILLVSFNAKLCFALSFL